jgi:ribosomal protein S18 acetylase RimI-like enzyme
VRDDRRRTSATRSQIVIRGARSRAQVEVVQSLMREYRNWLAHHAGLARARPAVVKGFRLLDEEIRSLPGAYTPPGGMLFLATKGGTPVGCAALRNVGPNVGELKRVYVRPQCRGAGIGRRLTRAALNRARGLGYHRVVLDTLPTMESAVRLYREMGFRTIPKYWDHPIPGALFFEYRLDGKKV